MKLKNRIIALATTVAIAVPAIAAAKHSFVKPLKCGPQDKDVGVCVAAQGTAFGADSTTLSFVATTQNLVVEDDDKTITFKVDGKKLDTKLGLRNQHMKEKVFTRTGEVKVRVQKSDVAGKPSGKVKADVTLNGKTAPIEISYTAKPEGNDIKVTGDFTLNYANFGVEKQCKAGVCIKPELKVKAAFLASK